MDNNVITTRRICFAVLAASTDPDLVEVHLHKIAAKLGVSVSTVRGCRDGGPGYSPETMRRVWAAVGMPLDKLEAIVASGEPVRAQVIGLERRSKRRTRVTIGDTTTEREGEPKRAGGER